MEEGTAVGLSVIITVIIYLFIIGIAITALTMILGEGSNPGFIENVFQIIAGRFGRLG